MRREEFFSRLMEQLTYLPVEDQEQLRDYYNELIYDGLEQGRAEESIIAGFGTPEDIAGQIRSEYKEYHQLVHRAAGKKQESGDRGQASSDYHSSQGPLHTVIVEAENIKVEVHPVNNGPVRVLFEPREGLDEVQFFIENGEFVFRHRMSRHFLNWISLFRIPQKIVLELPVSFRGNLRVKTTNSPIQAQSIQQLENTQLITSNARINCESLGSVSLLVQTTNGGITLSNITGDQMEAVTANGRISACNCRFPNAMLLSTKNGAVEGLNLIGDKIVLKTSNGAVHSSIIGAMADYDIQSHTTNGSSNLPNRPNPSLSKHLKVHTSNGRIKVDFL